MDNIQKIAQQVYDEAGYKSTIIKNNKYSIQLLPATLGFQVGVNLVKIFLPVLGAWADSEKREGFVLPEEESLYSEIALLLCSQLDKIDLVHLIQTLLNNLKVDGKEVDFDAHFRGKYANLVTVLEFAIKENFGDFLSDYLQSKGISIDSLSALSLKFQKKQDQIQNES